MATAIQFLTDKAGRKTAVVLPIADYEQLLEDLSDLAAVVNRRKEPSVPHDRFVRELKKDGLRSD